MIDFLEIQFWKVAKLLIKRGYGADCATMDYEDYFEGEPHDMPHELNAQNRCASCRAKEVCDWIDEHISLIKL